MTRAIIWGALEEGLVSTGRYTFLDRSRVSQAMKELNTQRDFNIYNQAGRKDFQQRLAADLICMTSVVKEKKGINVRVSIMNVETGEIEHSAQEYRATNEDQVIALMVKALAARVIPKQTIVAAPQVTSKPTSIPAATAAPPVSSESKYLTGTIRGTDIKYEVRILPANSGYGNKPKVRIRFDATDVSTRYHINWVLDDAVNVDRPFPSGADSYSAYGSVVEKNSIGDFFLNVINPDSPVSLGKFTVKNIFRE